METSKKITFARWGNYTVAIKALFERLGFEVVLPQTSNETIVKGVKHAPELFCFPMKILLGNYLGAIRQGAVAVFSAANSTGSCRQRYYGIVQEKIISDCGLSVEFVHVPLSPRKFFGVLSKQSGKSNFEIASALLFSFMMLVMIEKLEARARYARPRELNQRDTDKAVRASLELLETVKSFGDLYRAGRKINQQFSLISINANKPVPRVGLVGEIYGVSEAQINFGIEQKLGEQGIEAHRQMTLLYHLKKLVFPWMDWVITFRTRKYLGSHVGGHGRDAVSEMLTYVKDGFDGVIQILPFGCMPEVTVRPVLERIHKESGVPFLSLSLDEQVAEAGIETRLEAFGDVVHSRFERKLAAQKILDGNHDMLKL